MSIKTMLRTKKHARYVFHPDLELYRLAEGVLSCYILGNKISFLEESIDSDFSSFISQYINKPFTARDMEVFFAERNKKYNCGHIIRKLEKNRLINPDAEAQTASAVLINFTELPCENLAAVFKEFDYECRLRIINGERYKNQDRGFYAELEDIPDEQPLFIISDLQHKYKLAELNLHFFDKGRLWCPVVMDQFGGYIGPLLHSAPDGPCFNCYEKKIYPDASPKSGKTAKKPRLLNLFLRTALLEALKLNVAALPSSLIYSNLLEIDCFNHRSRKHYIYTDSNCTVCGV